MAQILIIDDSKLQRTYVRLVCEDAGHQVAEASNGTEGVAQATGGEACHVILLDLQMPDMSGQDVLRRLGELNVTTPVVVLTADDAADIQAECLQLGAARAVHKPDDPQELLGLIEAVLQ